MRDKTPAEIAERWAKNLRAATEEIRKGIAAVEESPPQMAARNMDKIRDNWLASLPQMQEGLKGVSKDEWIRLATAAIPKISVGIDARGKDRMAEAFNTLMPHIKEGQEKVKNMPNVTLEDSIARMEAFARHMSKYKKR